MKYDINSIRESVKSRQRILALIYIQLALLLLLAIALLIYYQQVWYLFFASLAYIIVVLPLCVKLAKSKLHVSFFTKDICGTLEKEHIRVTADTKALNERRHDSYTRVSRTCEIIIKENNGQTKMISDLPVKLEELYEVGDEVMLIGGTKYPVITGRAHLVQWICPICSKINSDKTHTCHNCKTKCMKQIEI